MPEGMAGRGQDHLTQDPTALKGIPQFVQTIFLHQIPSQKEDPPVPLL